jgi:hypothetical protein
MADRAAYDHPALRVDQVVHQVAELRLLALPLPVQPRVGIAGGAVRVVVVLHSVPLPPAPRLRLLRLHCTGWQLLRDRGSAFRSRSRFVRRWLSRAADRREALHARVRTHLRPVAREVPPRHEPRLRALPHYLVEEPLEQSALRPPLVPQFRQRR